MVVEESREMMLGLVGSAFLFVSPLLCVSCLTIHMCCVRGRRWRWNEAIWGDVGLMVAGPSSEEVIEDSKRKKGGAQYIRLWCVRRSRMISLLEVYWPLRTSCLSSAFGWFYGQGHIIVSRHRRLRNDLVKVSDEFAGTGCV